MKIKELRDKSIEELIDNLGELKFDLVQLRFQNKSGQLDNGNKISQTRKAIAQVMTVINEKKKKGETK